MGSLRELEYVIQLQSEAIHAHKECPTQKILTYHVYKPCRGERGIDGNVANHGSSRSKHKTIFKLPNKRAYRRAHCRGAADQPTQMVTI